jgi:hypothetical protein
MRDVKSLLDNLCNLGIGIDAPMVESGINSMMAVQFRSRLSQHTCMTIPSTFLFDYPSLSAIAHYLETATTRSTTGPPGHTARPPCPPADLSSILEQLGVNGTDRDGSLMEHGVNSMLAVQLRSRLAQ